MPFQNGYRGVAGGSVQSAVTDQPGFAVDGMLAFASDLNQHDAYYIGETGGIAAGRGISLSDVSDDYSFQKPNQEAVLPADAAVAADFAGILIFDEAMQSDENGVPGWAEGRMGRVLTAGRAGGRLYVKVVEAVDHTADSVHLITIAGTDLLYEKGQFCGTARLGDAAEGTSIDVGTKARWVTSASAGGYAILELL